jgi:hypothetical protein
MLSLQRQDTKGNTFSIHTQLFVRIEGVCREAVKRIPGQGNTFPDIFYYVDSTMPWAKTTITTDSGERRTAIAPLIISASRSTDIPAFYGEWFLRRLASGYVRWVNPWNGRSQFVSLEQARLFVFWSKNPKPFFPVLDELDRRGIRYLFHHTLNDYEREGFEPYLPSINERIATHQRLAARIGRERLIWRFDPLLITEALTPSELLVRIRRIGDDVAAYSDRLIVSFITLYAKVSRNMRNAGIRLKAWEKTSQAVMLRAIGEYGSAWNLPVFTCATDHAEKDCGVRHGKCIDDATITRVWGDDGKLMEYINSRGGGKDRGQRTLCRCIYSKDIGRYNTCGHSCIYCYANTTPQGARRANKTIDSVADSIGAYSSNISSGAAAGSSFS